ncbi:MAG TPA: hypothetical protein VMM35_11705 [Longimicrobiales bacterium]|nr:hypothetical protein [Longimicrobiales bacterium]
MVPDQEEDEGDEESSLAIVVMGGLATSTLFTLVGLPVWYSALEDAATWIGRALPRRRGRRAAGEGSVVVAGGENAEPGRAGA